MSAPHLPRQLTDKYHDLMREIARPIGPFMRLR
jgi:hypothetical protein